MSVSKPDWWFSEEENFTPRYKDRAGTSNQSNTQQVRTEFNEHSDIPVKKKNKTKLSKFEKSDNLTIKELTRLLINKTELVETLQTRLEQLNNEFVKCQLDLSKKTTEYSTLYTENCVLRKVVGDLDVDKPKTTDTSNVIFLSENAPQEVVDVVWKALSKIYHPDCGGSEEKMKQLNLARDNFYKKNNWK